MFYQREKSDCGASMDKRRFDGRFLLIFSMLYCITAFFVFLPYLREGRSLICGGDASLQHYPALAYYGAYLRDILKTLWQEHRLVIPAWDMGIGYGGDIVATLHYYCLGDPLTLISVFFSEAQSELCYSLLTILRLYLSGVAMMCYCRHRRIRGYSVVVAGLVYCFSGYAVGPGVFHPFFAIPMVYLPLLLIGADRLFENRSPLLFMSTVALALLSNFYFFYMLVLIVVLYAAVRYFEYYHKFEIKSFLHIFCKFLICGVIGMLIAMPVFLPNVMSLLQSDRISVERQIPLLYPAAYYRSLFEGVVSEFGQYYVYLSMSSVAVAALFALIALMKKENRGLLFSIVVLFSFLLLPYIGSFFNGMNYVTNRWIWALIFAISYAAAKALPQVEELTMPQLLRLLVVCFGFYLLCMLPDHAISKQGTISIWVLCICVLLMGLVTGKVISRKAFRGTILLLTMVTVAVNGYFHATGKPINWVANTERRGAAYERYFHGVVDTVDDLPNEGAGRFDSAQGLLTNNAALLHDIGGTGFYFSTINPGTAQFQRAQMLNSTVDQKYSGLDGRSYLDAAMSVAYYISGDNHELPRPYGYDRAVGDHIYTSQHILPLVYAFDSVYTDFEGMSVTQRQQALLQRAMIESDHGLPDLEPEYLDHAVAFEIVSAHDVSMHEEGFDVEKAGASLVLRLEPAENSELYCIFEGLEFWSEDQAAQASMSISSGSIWQNLLYSTPFDNYTSDRHNFLVNLGYAPESRTELTLTFNHAGQYRFSSFSVEAQPMDRFFDQIDGLADSGIGDIAVENDRICFSSHRSAGGIACIAVPYQEGWSATIDGQEAEVFNIQQGLCGIYLDAGQHHVVMQYENPARIPSMVLCLVGIISMLGVMYFYKKRNGII